MKLIDAIGIGLITTGIVMTAVNVFATHHRAPSEIQDFSIHEIPSPSPDQSPMMRHGPPGRGI